MLQAHTQPEGHSGELIETQIVDHKCGVLLQFRGHTDLPKSTLKSIVEKCVAPAMLSSASCILGRG